MSLSYYNGLALTYLPSPIPHHFDVVFIRLIRVIFLGVNLMIATLVLELLNGYPLGKIQITLHYIQMALLPVTSCCSKLKSTALLN